MSVCVCVCVFVCVVGFNWQSTDGDECHGGDHVGDDFIDCGRGGKGKGGSNEVDARGNARWFWS